MPLVPAAQATSCKANHKGVILECTVTLGRVKVAKQAGNWGSKLRRLLHKYDSVALTFLEGGIEYVIYDSSRVSCIKVHQMLHHCGSNLGEESSSSGSFRISTAADTGCGSTGSGQSSEHSGSSGSSVSGDSSCDSSDPCRFSSSSQARTGSSSSSCGPTCAPALAASKCSTMQGTTSTALQEALCVLQGQRQLNTLPSGSLHGQQHSQQQQQQASLSQQVRILDMPSQLGLLPASQQQHGQLQAVC
jgi:hypothetical protein